MVTSSMRSRTSHAPARPTGLSTNRQLGRRAWQHGHGLQAGYIELQAVRIHRVMPAEDIGSQAEDIGLQAEHSWLHAQGIGRRAEWLA